VRLLLLAGTGGAGTSTVAAATAVRAARRGVKTLLLTPEPGGSAPFGRIDGEVEPGLVLRTLDPRARADRAWAAVERPATALLSALGVAPLEAAELTALPGLDDVLTLLEIREAAVAGWDLVVVDAPALTRTVRLLGLPEAVPRAVNRVIPLERRMLWAMGHGASPAGAAAPPRELVAAAERAQLEFAGVREVLTDPGTVVRLVVAPQPGAVAAATAARTALTLHGLAVDGVVVNRLVPAGDHPWLRERARAEAGVVADAEAAFAPLPVVRLGELAVPPSGADELAALDVDDLGAAAPAVAPSVDREGDAFTLVLPLPGAQRHEIVLGRRGDELLLDVGGQRRVLTLPSGLRRCEVSGAALRGGALRVTFRPDPDLWRAL
jgi:arsenite-transporting ATPase